MRNIHLNNIHSFCVISDVHLREPNSPLTAKFIQTIRELEKVDAVIFLGDIFDFITVSTPFFLSYWRNVFAAFTELKQKGVEVYFTEGNHDFGFEHFENSQLKKCFTECGDFSLTISHPQYGNIVLKHGDEVVCKPSYHHFRKLVKSNWFQKTTNSLFAGSWMQSIFSRYAKLSRKGDKYRILENSKMEKMIQDFLKKKYSDCDIFIMGHVHKNVDKMAQVENKMVRILIGQAWFDQPNILYVTEKEICRKFI